jgi:hypothetical protein
MNCPLCASPLLFGATSCHCGYNESSSPGDALPIELSYWEGLRAYWRAYWPTQAVGLILIFGLAMISPVPALSGMGALLPIALQVALSAVALFLFVPRICFRPYRGFSLVVVEVMTGATTQRLRGRPRVQVSLFLWWRQILAGMFASVLAMPLNALLSLMGLQLARWVAILAGVLVIGPILLKMLIGHEFEGFRIEARREDKHGTPVVADTSAATSE